MPKLPLIVEDLREDFEAWVGRHNKNYHSEDEKQKRFHIWSENHHRTKAKNERHGPCRKTGKTVFGSNHFQDLTTDEFREQYLNANNLRRGPLPLGQAPPEPLGPHTAPPKRHETVHRRFLDQQHRQRQRRAAYNQGCEWYNVSCILRYIFTNYFYGFGRTMEPAYDADSYPTGKCVCIVRLLASDRNMESGTDSIVIAFFCLSLLSAVDWRDVGAVTEVHSQGSCGACWAITAVETIESVHFIATGSLYDLAVRFFPLPTGDPFLCGCACVSGQTFSHILSSHLFAAGSRSYCLPGRV